jgi:very-short-patch-repair endonuclease
VIAVRPASIPPLLRQDVFRGVDAVTAGLLTVNQLRGSTWRRLFPGVYVHRGVPVTHALRAEAATILLPEAVVTGRSAAVLWSVPLAGPEDDVEVTVPPGAHQRRIPGLVVRRAVLLPQDRWARGGIPVTTPEATAVRLAAALPHDEAVAAVDQVVASGVVDLAPIRTRAAAGQGPGSARARAVCLLADGLAQSPRETWLRLELLRAGLPAPVAQHRIVHEGRFLARVDFAWPERKLAVEYDGLWHGEPGQFARDRRRLNQVHGAGWRVVFVTTADHADPRRIMAEIARALGVAR